MNIAQNIFRAYDIRGVYPSELNTESVYLLGRGVGTLLRTKYTEKKEVQVAIGCDHRIHSPELKEACIRGLVESGCNVTDIGLSPSPFLYFTVAEQKFDGGVNITASHNPKQYNGLKLIGREAHSIYGDEIQKIKNIIETKELKEGKGTKKTADMTEKYVSAIASGYQLKRKLKIVVDCGNGVAGKLYPDILEKMGCEVVRLFCELDGNFPNHEPDPIVEKNLIDLKKKVSETKADIGLAFDGDGDRIGIVDEKGITHDANQILVLLARDLLSRKKSKVIYTVSCSSIIAEEVKRLGGEAVMVPVGHSFVENAMEKEHALLGGEQSGHFFLADNYYSFDDACHCAAKMLAIISNSEKSVSGLFADMPKVFASPEIRPDIDDDKKFKFMEIIKKDFTDAFGNITAMDGIRVDLDNGSWASVRASNTSPKLSVCVEARSQKDLDEMNTRIWNILEKHGINK